MVYTLQRLTSQVLKGFLKKEKPYQSLIKPLGGRRIISILQVKKEDRLVNQLIF